MMESKSRIVVADDERNIRKHLAIVLEAAGYSVDYAAESRFDLRLTLDFFSLAPKCRTIDAENGRGVFQGRRTADHANDMFPLDFLQREISTYLGRFG